MDASELKKRRKSLRSWIAKADRRLRSHNEHLAKRLADPQYAVGKWAQLGLRAEGPCCIVENKAIRLSLRAAVLSCCEWPVGALVCHRCDDERCIAPGHLFPGTHQDNMRDCALKGRWSRRIVEFKAVLAKKRAELLAVELLLAGVSKL